MNAKDETMAKEERVGVVYDVTKEELALQLQAAIQEFFVGTCTAQENTLVFHL